MSSVSNRIPVITIDGPTASGKGTLAHAVADYLGWHVLDSGALYRLTALVCVQKNISHDQLEAITQVARFLDVRFTDHQIFLNGTDVTDDIRQEAIGNLASQVAAYPAVRTALLQRQLDFRTLPGLVADGRDMGTVVFKDATLKIFLLASAEARAQRRVLQLQKKGIGADYKELLHDLQMRDKRDKERDVAPLVAAPDAYVIDSSLLTIEQTVAMVLDRWHAVVMPNKH